MPASIAKQATPQSVFVLWRIRFMICILARQKEKFALVAERRMLSKHRYKASRAARVSVYVALRRLDRAMAREKLKVAQAAHV
jgi:hypothetical protein